MLSKKHFSPLLVKKYEWNESYLTKLQSQFIIERVMKPQTKFSEILTEVCVLNTIEDHVSIC